MASQSQSLKTMIDFIIITYFNAGIMKLTVFTKADTASGGVFTIGQTFDHEGLALMHLPSLAGPTVLFLRFLDAVDSDVLSNSGDLAKIKLYEITAANVDFASIQTSSDSGDVSKTTAVPATRGWTWTTDDPTTPFTTYSPQKNVKASTLVKDFIAGAADLTDAAPISGVLISQDADNQEVDFDLTATPVIWPLLTSPVEVAEFTPGAGTDFGE